MKWTIRSKMLAGFSGVCLLVAFLGISAVYEAAGIRDIGKDLGTNTVPSVDILGQLNADTSDLRLFHLMHIDSPSEGEMARIEADVAHLRSAIDKRIQEYEPLIRSDEERKLYDEFVRAHRVYREDGPKLLAKSRANQDDDARKDYFGVANEHYEASSRTLNDLISFNRREAAMAVDNAHKLYSEARFIVGIVTFLVVAAAFSFGVWLSGNIATPISRLAEVFRKIAAGDAKGAAEDLKAVGGTDRAFAADEVGSLILSAREMEAFRADMTSSLRDGVARLASGSAQIASTAKEYSETSAAQASAVAEVSTTVEEIKQTSEVAATGARQVAQAADDAAKSGIVGRERLNDAAAMVRTIEGRVGGIASQILDLSERIEQIGTIVDAVSDLAEQSNLLAVNASIEAAKAGEHGRGFSVVASEVRSLAEQSKRATLQIRSILLQIQKATQSAVMATEEGTKRSEDGRHAIEAVREVIDNLAGVLEESAAKARQISAASTQQASGIGQIATALAGIAKSARDNASGVRQLEAAVLDIERSTGDLRARSDRL